MHHPSMLAVYMCLVISLVNTSFLVAGLSEGKTDTPPTVTQAHSAPFTLAPCQRGRGQVSFVATL